MAATVVPLSGLGLPAVRTKGSYFASRSAHDVAWGDAILAALVPVGSRVMRRGVGSSAPFLMEPLDGQFVNEVQSRVAEAVARQCPHVVVTNVLIRRASTPTGTSPNTVEMVIGFFLNSDPNTAGEKIVRIDRSAVMTAVRSATSI